MKEKTYTLPIITISIAIPMAVTRVVVIRTRVVLKLIDIGPPQE